MLLDLIYLEESLFVCLNAIHLLAVGHYSGHLRATCFMNSERKMGFSQFSNRIAKL